MILVKYFRHPPSDFGYQGLNVFSDIGLQSGSVLTAVWASMTSPGPSDDAVVDVGRHILNSKSSFLKKIRVSETL